MIPVSRTYSPVRKAGVLLPLPFIESALKELKLSRLLQAYQGSVNLGRSCMFCSKPYSMKECLLFSIRTVLVLTCFTEEVAKSMPGGLNKMLAARFLILKRHCLSITLPPKKSFSFQEEGVTLFTRHRIMTKTSKKGK